MTTYPEQHLNQRELRARAHGAIEQYKKGELPHSLTKQLVLDTLGTKKGQNSGLLSAFRNSSLSEPNLEIFAVEFEAAAVIHSEEPILLRAGGVSNWYVDARRGLSTPDALAQASDILIAHAEALAIKRDAVVGMGIAGMALSTGISLNDVAGKIPSVYGNDSKSPDQRYGYGLHGIDVAGKDVWVVDDIASTGDSLVTLIEMTRDAGGIVTHASVLTDRSMGIAAHATESVNVELHSVFQFNEHTGRFSPQQQAA